MGPLLAGIGSAISSIASPIAGYFGQKDTNRTNLKLAQQARDYDTMMWNKQNEYNTPQMQMQRYTEAGLNPNLIYGQGTPGNAQQAPKAPVPQVENSAAHLSQMSIAPALSMYQDWLVKKAQINNLEAETRAKEQNTALNSLRAITQNYTNRRLSHESQYFDINALNNAEISKQKMYLLNRQNLYQEQKNDYSLKAFPALLNQINARNMLLQEQQRGQRLQNDLDSQLKPYGVSSQDQLWQRILTIMLNPMLNKSKGVLQNYQK